MTTTGRPTIGPKTPINIPQADLDRLTTLAVEHGTTRAEQIRTAITNHLGPDTTDPRITEWVANAQANAWTWWTTSRDYSDQPAWNEQVAHALNQASMIIGLHSNDWAPDLTSVWETIAVTQINGEQDVEWVEALVAFANLVRDSDLSEWVAVRVDVINETLTVETGGGWGAMRPATYRWSEEIGYGKYSRGRIEAIAHMDHQAEPDTWANAARLLLHDADGITAPAVREAEALLHRWQKSIPTECVDQAMDLWGQRRREEAQRRLGGEPLRRYNNDALLDEWAQRLLGRPLAMTDWKKVFEQADAGKEVEAALEADRANAATAEEIRVAYEEAVDAELAKMAAEEEAAHRQAQEARRTAEEAEREAYSRRRPFTPKRRRGKAAPEVEEAPAPTEEPLTARERELLEGKRSEQ